MLYGSVISQSDSACLFDDVRTLTIRFEVVVSIEGVTLLAELVTIVPPIE